MKYKFYKNYLLIALIFTIIGCERDIDDLDLATNPAIAEIFIDEFSGGLEYAAFAGSDVTAFEVVTDEKYLGTSSMRIAVPDFEDPKGAYAGGAFFTLSGRDLSSYNVLTFWAKASQPANIDIIGIGNDLGENKFEANIQNVPVNTNWKKYYIPLPDASKLTDERGMFYYSEGPEDGRGYTIWFDEVKFEKLATVSHGSAKIRDGQDETVTAETGNIFRINGVSTSNLPTGVNQDVNCSSAYFNFESSNPTVASVNDEGEVMVLDAGTTIITAALGATEADGSLRIVSTGDPVIPMSPAPTPTQDAADVISIFSNQYEDRPVDFYNGFWEFSTTLSDIIQLGMDDVIRYTMLNFVGIQFTSPTIDITEMTHFHIDIWTPNATDLPNDFKVLLVDIGPDGSFDGNDNSSHELTFTSPTLQSEEWVSLDIPLSNFAGLTGRSNLAQIVLSGTLSNVFVDNMYFYKGEGGGENEPSVAAPTPTTSASNVISLFSDAYNDVPVDTWRTEWSSATFEDVMVDGNPTKKYSALDFVGIETVMNQIDISNMTHFHLDVWSNNFSFFGVKLVDFGPNGIFDGGDDTEHQVDFSGLQVGQWISIDIPISDFVNLTSFNNIAQLILVGQPTGAANVWVDNVYFYNDASGPNEPTEAAPEPTLDQGNVISLFSDVYNDVTVDTWRTDWSAADFEDVTVAGNATKKYSSLDFVGIETVSMQIDISAMTHFHIDVWSSDFSFFAVKLVDFGPDGQFGGGDDTEHQIDFNTPNQSTWISYDIPLSDFTGLTTKNNFAQLILVGQPTGANTVFVDNVYFHN